MQVAASATSSSAGAPRGGWRHDRGRAADRGPPAGAWGVRGAGEADAGGGGGDLRFGAGDVRRAEPEGEPSGAPPARAGGGAGAAGGGEPGTDAGAGGGAAGGAEGGRRVPAAGPRVPVGAAGVHAG